jgi:hypothetical protein
MFLIDNARVIIELIGHSFAGKIAAWVDRRLTDADLDHSKTPRRSPLRYDPRAC